MTLYNAVIVCGFQKCGTTSMFDFLKKTNDFRAPYSKELDFFLRDYDEQTFQSIFCLNQARPIILDASPQYACQNAALNIHKTYGQKCKIIFCVRTPSRRLRSHLSMELRRGMSLRQAVEYMETDRIYFQSTPKILYNENMKRRFLANSYYWDIIELFKNLFGPDQVLILDVDELNNFATINKLEKFLNIKFANKIIKVQNEGGIARFHLLKQITRITLVKKIAKSILGEKIYTKFWWYSQTKLFINKSKKMDFELPANIEHWLETQDEIYRKRF